MGSARKKSMVRLRFLVWVPWSMMEPLIVVEAQEGEGD